MKLRLVEVTPEKAKLYLQSNLTNRPIREGKVLEYALTMEQGEWRTDVLDPICVTVNGNLINGQHRLHAVILANKTVPLWFQFDSAEDLYKYLDTGITRRLCDLLKGESRKKVASLALCAYATEYGHAPILSALGGKTTTEHNTARYAPKYNVVEYAQSHYDELLEACRYGDNMRNALGKCSLKALCYACWLIKWLGVDTHLIEFVDDFSKEVSTDYNTQFIKNMIAKKMVQQGKTLEPNETLPMVLLAYEMYDQPKKLKSVTGTEKVLQKYNGLINKKRASK